MQVSSLLTVLINDRLGWTLNGAIQPHIDVYLSQDTFTEVQRSFPYLVSKEFASGGGDVRFPVRRLVARLSR